MSRDAALYLDTSVALRATLERGTTPEIEARIAAAPALITSRLSVVESARALLRLRRHGGVAERNLADARRELDALWSRCELWELSVAVCELASHVDGLGRPDGQRIWSRRSDLASTADGGAFSIAASRAFASPRTNATCTRQS